MAIPRGMPFKSMSLWLTCDHLWYTRKCPHSHRNICRSGHDAQAAHRMALAIRDKTLHVVAART